MFMFKADDNCSSDNCSVEDISRELSKPESGIKETFKCYDECRAVLIFLIYSIEFVLW